MRTLSPASVLEMHGLHSSGVELFLFELRMPDGTALRYTDNTETVHWGGHDWLFAPVVLSELRDQEARELPGLTANVSNLTREVQIYLEEHGGLVGSTAVIRLINSATGDEVWTQDEFTVLKSSVTAQWATFTLGAASPFRKRFPLGRVLNNYCRYRSHQTDVCRFVKSCDHTLADCRRKPACSSADADHGRFYNGQPRTILFGGFPAAGAHGVKA